MDNKILKRVQDDKERASVIKRTCYLICDILIGS